MSVPVRERPKGRTLFRNGFKVVIHTEVDNETMVWKSVISKLRGSFNSCTRQEKILSVVYNL